LDFTFQNQCQYIENCTSSSGRTLTCFNLSFLGESRGRFTPLFPISDMLACADDGGGTAKEPFLAIAMLRSFFSQGSRYSGSFSFMYALANANARSMCCNAPISVVRQYKAARISSWIAFTGTRFRSVRSEWTWQRRCFTPSSPSYMPLKAFWIASCSAAESSVKKYRGVHCLDSALPRLHHCLIFRRPAVKIWLSSPSVRTWAQGIPEANSSRTSTVYRYSRDSWFYGSNP
jgi:hypothetical protein